MEVHCDRDPEIDGALMAVPGGSLDTQSVDDLWQAVTHRLDEGTPSLMLDLSRVELITSAGVGIMVRLLHRIQALGGRMVVFGANPRVAAVIDAVMLTQILNLCDTIVDARERLSGEISRTT